MFLCYTRKSWLTDRMVPALLGINTLSKEKSVCVCYTRKSWSADKIMPALSGIKHAMLGEKCVFMLYKEVVVG